MARQVYYDPFGARTEGFRAGMQDEMGLQKNIRDARSMDWDYRNMKPLELQEAQRIAAFNQYADPYARRALGTNEQMSYANLFGAQLPLYGRVGNITGDFNPAVRLAQQYGGLPNTAPTPQQLQGAREDFNWDRIYQTAEANRNYQLRQDELANQVARQNWEATTHGQITPRDLVYSPLFTSQGGGAGGTVDSPNDWSPYGATAPQTGQQPTPEQIQQYLQNNGIQPFQLPSFGLNIPGFDPTGQNLNPTNSPVLGNPAYMPAPAGIPYAPQYIGGQVDPNGNVQIPNGVGNPYPPGYQPATGPNAINTYPMYDNGQPMTYGSPDWRRYVEMGIPPPGTFPAPPQGEQQVQPQNANVDWAF